MASRTLEIEVAAGSLGFSGVFTTPWGREDIFGVPFDALPRATVRAEEVRSIRSVLIEAGQAMGVGLGSSIGASWDRLHFIDLYRPEDDAAGRRRDGLNMVPLIDRRGHAYWGNFALDVSLAELERAVEAGAVEGDPHRLYLLLYFPQGSGLTADWLTTLDAIKEAVEALGAIGAVYGGVQVIERALSFSARGLNALQENWSNWRERKGTPRDVLSLAVLVPRTVVETALLLDCQEDDAEAVLAFLGFEEDEEGRWHRSGRLDARFLTDNAQFAIEAPDLWVQDNAVGVSRHLTDEEIAAMYRERAKALGTGDLPGLDWSPYRTRPPGGLIDRPFEPPDSDSQ